MDKRERDNQESKEKVPEIRDDVFEIRDDVFEPREVLDSARSDGDPEGVNPPIVSVV